MKTERCLIANKRIFRSHDDAVAAASEFTSPYLCRMCLHWHLGHSKKQRRIERQALLRRMTEEAEQLGLYDQPEAALLEAEQAK